MTLNRITLFLLVLAWMPARAEEPIQLAWDRNFLTLSAEHLPGKQIRIHYIEAYCRPGSTNRVWNLTTIGHTTKLISISPERTALVLECTLRDGVVVQHEIRSKVDEVEFQITANNPTDKPSEAHWAQPCVRLDAFTGRDKTTYLEKSFIFLDGKLARMPTPQWATEAVYTPGQVWAPAGVPREDVNPRPLSRLVPSNGLIGCFSADEKTVLGIAFEPYQELFQGVIACLHSDFRIGGLEAGQTKRVRGKIYLAPDVDSLLARYHKDFPEHTK